MAIRLQIRRDTASNWAQANPVLSQGELIEVLPEGNNPAKFKIGDGVRSYNDLPFIGITSNDVITALGFTPYDSSNPEGYTSNQGTVTSVNNVQPVNGNVTIEIPDSATWGNITGDLDNQTDLSTALGSKVDRTSIANKVYGTDANGDQTTYDVDSFGQVDDVTVGGTSVVTNKVAVLGSMAGETASDYATASQGALADSAIQTINNIAPIDGNAIIEAGNGIDITDNAISIKQGGNSIYEFNGTYTSTQIYNVTWNFNIEDTVEFMFKYNVTDYDASNGRAIFEASNSSTSSSRSRLSIYVSNNDAQSSYGQSGIRFRYFDAEGDSYSSTIIGANFITGDYFNRDLYLKILKRYDASTSKIGVIISLSTDGINWNDSEEVMSASTTLGSLIFTTLKIGESNYAFNGWQNHSYMKGTIDFSPSYIKVNDAYFWQGSNYVSAGVATATPLLYGLVKPDGTSITVNDGVLSGNIGTVTSVNNIEPVNGNVTLPMPEYTAGTGLQLSDQNEFNILQEDERDSALVLVGSPTELSTNVYTNFSSSNYLTTPNTINIKTSDTFEMVIKIKQTSTNNSGVVFCGFSDSSNYIYLTQSKSSDSYFYQLFTMGGIGRNQNNISTQNIVAQSTSDYILLKFRRADNKFYLDYSTDGSTWNTGTNSDIYISTLAEVDFTFSFGYGNTPAPYVFNYGIFDFNGCYIKINDTIQWSGIGTLIKAPAKATNNLYGLVKPDGTSITVNDGTISSAVKDVQINSTSILSDGVANIPIGTSSVLGVYKINANQGISAYSAGDLVIISANESEIVAKTHNYKPIVPSKLDIAIREGLGNNSLTWTDEYKESARNTIGAGQTTAVIVDWID